MNVLSINKKSCKKKLSISEFILFYIYSEHFAQAAKRSHVKKNYVIKMLENLTEIM